MKTLLTLVFCAFLSLASFAQATDSTKTDSINSAYLNLYLDGGYGYQDYIKTEIPFVNYVRDRFDGDVHLLITAQGTGSGGADYTLFFLGQKTFEGKNDTLHYIANTNATSEEIRAGLVQVIKMGLLPYIAKMNAAFPVQITFTGSTNSEERQEDDKWKGWVYSISSYANASLTSNYESYSISGNVSADKVTEEWKLGFSYGANYNTDVFDFGDGDIYESFNNSTYGNTTIVNSLNDHWSLGGEGFYSTSTYSNYKTNIAIAPGIEYDVFPYDESTTKLLTFFYKVGPEYHQYIDSTIYNKTEELLMRQRLDVSLSLTQKWGSITVGINGSNYFHDLTKNGAGCFTSINWRIVEGLSLNGFFTLDFINDQLNIPKGDLTDEEILLQITERQTNYSFYSFFGLSYTFGSIYNNVVNPRFSGGSYSFYFSN